MDLLTLFPFILIGIAVLGGALLVYEKYFRKTETSAQVVERLRAQGIGGPNDPHRLDHVNCKYCGSHFDDHEHDEPQDEDLMDPALFALGVAAADALAQSGPPADEPWQGGGGQFSGAGASGDFSDPDPSSSPDSSNSSDSDYSSGSDSSDSSDSSSSDSSSSDSSSSDSGSDS